MLFLAVQTESVDSSIGGIVIRWKLYERRIAFVESSTKVGGLSLKALRKKDCFRWKLYERRIAFVESSRKAGWLSLKALWKPFKKRVNRDNTKFRDNIAYVGGPSFPDLLRSLNICHPVCQIMCWRRRWILVEMHVWCLPRSGPWPAKAMKARVATNNSPRSKYQNLLLLSNIKRSLMSTTRTLPW